MALISRIICQQNINLVATASDHSNTVCMVLVCRTTPPETGPDGGDIKQSNEKDGCTLFQHFKDHPIFYGEFQHSLKEDRCIHPFCSIFDGEYTCLLFV